MEDLGHGQVWWADLDKARPVVVLTRARVAPLLSRVLVAPVTSVDRRLRSEVAIGEAEGVDEGSVVSLDNTQLVPVNHLLLQVGEFSPTRWPEVCRAMADSIGC